MCIFSEFVLYFHLIILSNFAYFLDIFRTPVAPWFTILAIFHDDVIKWKHFHVTSPLCGEFTGPGESPTQRPVTRSFDVFFDLRLNKRLSKQPWGWWFEPLSWSLWRHCNASLLCVSVTGVNEYTFGYLCLLEKCEFVIVNSLKSPWILFVKKLY